MSLVNNVGDKITNPKHILEEEEFSKRFIHQEIWIPTAQLSMSSLKSKMHYQKKSRKRAN